MPRPPLFIGAVLLLSSVVQAANIDCGVGGKATIFDRLNSVGTAKINYRSTSLPCIQKGPAGTTAQLSGTFDILYVDQPGSAQGAFVMPAPWFLNVDGRAKFLNTAAPSGPSQARKLGVKAEKLARFGSRGLGDTSAIDITNAPGPGGVLAVLTVHNAVDGNTYRMCTKWATSSGSTIRHQVVDGGVGRKLFLDHGVVSSCSIVPPTTSTSTSVTSSTSTSVTTTTSTSLTSTTSTSLASTTSTSTSSTTTTSILVTHLSFVTGTPGGNCGTVRNGGSAGTLLKTLTCGGLNTGAGSGATSVPEGPTPGGAETQFSVSGGPTYTLSARTSAQTGSTNNCSDVGCKFGTWLPIPGTLSTCVQNTFSSAATGTLNSVTGDFTASVVLASAVFLTNNAGQPCPLCVGGTVGVTNSGTCDAAWRNSSNVGTPSAGNQCTPTDSSGHTYDCIPPPSNLTGTIPVNLSPLTTAKVTKTDTIAPNRFCTGQTVNGAFGQNQATYIDETGDPHPVGTSPSATKLASVFCIPATGNGGIDLIAGLPGPGATSLPGTLKLIP